MPLYEYQCECKNEREVILSFQDTQPQVCECGKVMQRRISCSSSIIKPYARNMALNTLNEQGYRKGLPNRWWKPEAERKAFEGTQSKAKTVW